MDSHAAVTPPYAVEELSLERVDRALRQALENDLAALLCLSYDGLASSFSGESPHHERPSPKVTRKVSP